jgi:anti-sigma regulatory factor (Ser/Thr protein kinase)
MAGHHDTSSANGHRFNPGSTPFPRFEKRRREAGWQAVDLGGHEVISRLHMQLRPGAEAAGEGRHALDPLEGSIDERQLDTLRLLVTELITNSVRHAEEAKWIGLDIVIYANAVRVQVSDRGAGFDPPDEPEPHRDRPGGWGLCLVDRMSDRWGVANNADTRVWFELDRGLASAA